MSEQVNIEEVVADEHDTLGEVSVGEHLRRGREACGLQVGEIAQTLKLGARQVEALEAGDWQGLPGQTFVRGFVRNYARVVQLDPAPLMAQLDRVLAKPMDNLTVQDMAPAAMPSTGGSGTRRDRFVMLLGAGLVILAPTGAAPNGTGCPIPPPASGAVRRGRARCWPHAEWG